MIIFCLLLGIHKADVGSWIAPGKYQIAVTYIKEITNWNQINNCERIEYLYMDYGMHDTKRIFEMVTPLMLGLEWRREIEYTQDDYLEYEFYK